MPDEPNTPRPGTLEDFVRGKQAPFLRLHSDAMNIALALPVHSNARKTALTIANLMLESARSYDWEIDHDSGADTAPLLALDGRMRALMCDLQDFAKLPEAIRALRSYMQSERQRKHDRDMLARLRSVTLSGDPCAPSDPRLPESPPVVTEEAQAQARNDPS